MKYTSNLNHLFKMIELFKINSTLRDREREQKNGNGQALIHKSDRYRMVESPPL
jgi:hypothetical protein